MGEKCLVTVTITTTTTTTTNQLIECDPLSKTRIGVMKLGCHLTHCAHQAEGDKPKYR